MSEKRVYSVQSREKVEPPKRRSPMTIIFDSIEGDYWTIKHVAAHIGVHPETIRRLIRKVDVHGNRTIKAPSSAVKVGQVVMYLFDVDDVLEVENHYSEFGYSFGRIDPKKSLKSQIPKEEE